MLVGVSPGSIKGQRVGAFGLVGRAASGEGGSEATSGETLLASVRG